MVATTELYWPQRHPHPHYAVLVGPAALDPYHSIMGLRVSCAVIGLRIDCTLGSLSLFQQCVLPLATR